MSRLPGALRTWAWGLALPRALGWCLVGALPVLFLAVFFAWPVLALMGRGFVVDGALDLGGFSDVLSRPRTWRIVGLTLGQAALGTLISLVLGVPGAYVLHRCRFPGRTVVRALVAVPFVLPTVVVGVAFRSLLAEGGPLGGLGLDGTFLAIVLALVFFNYTVVVRTVGGLWEQLDPRLEQAARALGASPWRAFRTVTLPALGPAIVSAAALVFLFCSTAFGTVLVLGGMRYGTIETEIWIQTTQFLDLRSAAVLSVLQFAVVGAALVVSARARSRRERALGLVEAGVAGRRLRLRGPDRVGGAELVAVGVTTATVGGLLALPLVGLAVRSLHGPHGWGLENYRNLSTAGRSSGSAADASNTGALGVTVWQAAGNSLRAAALAAALAVVIGGLIAVIASRRPRSPGGRRALSVLDGLFMLPLGVSAVTVGFGFLITLNRPLGLDVDLRTAGLLVPIAQAVVAIPLVVRSVLPVLRAVDPRLREVAATLGASPGRVLRAVDGPLALRALGLGVGFAFAVSLGEFGATAFLARPDSATLPVAIFRLIGRPGAENHGMALAAAMVLALLTAAVMLVVERLRGQQAGEF